MQCCSISTPQKSNPLWCMCCLYFPQEVYLYPWDAGVDSGISYESPDQQTQPSQPIKVTTMHSSVDINLLQIRGVAAMRLSEPLLFVANPCDSNRWRLKSLQKNKYNLATTFYFKYFYFLKQGKISKVLYRNESRVCSSIMCCVGIFTLADISEDHDPGPGG